MRGARLLAAPVRPTPDPPPQLRSSAGLVGEGEVEGEMRRGRAQRREGSAPRVFPKVPPARNTQGGHKNIPLLSWDGAEPSPPARCEATCSPTACPKLHSPNTGCCWMWDPCVSPCPTSAVSLGQVWLSIQAGKGHPGWEGTSRVIS